MAIRTIQIVRSYAWRLLQDHAADGLIEAAIALPILLSLFMGAAELTPVIRAQIELSNAARAGAQYGTQNSTTAADTTGIRTAAANDAPDLTLGTTNVNLTYICSDGTAASGTPAACSASTAAVETIVTVTTNATVTPWVTLPLLPTSYTLTGSAAMKCLKC